MKKTWFIPILALAFVAACKSKKPAVAAKPPAAEEQQLALLKTKLPNSTLQELQRGHELFYGVCTKCHGVEDVTSFEEARLQKIMNKMSAKAHLGDLDKDAVWKYALALNLSAKK